MGEASKGDSKAVEEKIYVVAVHRFEDLTTSVPVAMVVRCYKCKEKCPITPITLKTISGKTKKFQVICSRCASKDERFQKTAKYEPFTPEQLAEMEEIRKVSQTGLGG